jgi:hypothetical protein
LLRAEYIEGAVDSRNGKVYIAVKQIAGSTDIKTEDIKYIIIHFISMAFLLHKHTHIYIHIYEKFG